MKHLGWWCLVLLVGVTATSVSMAAGVVIDPDAVTNESVYPKFRHNEAVKRRAVTLSQKIKFSVLSGVARNNAYYDAYTVSLAADYHFSELHGMQLYTSLFLSTPSAALEALNATENISNLELSPRPKYLLGFFYKLTPWYGKISLSKTSIYNISLQGTAGPALFNIGGKFFPALSVGIGPQFYFKDGWGLVLDFRGIFYKGPDPLSVDLSNFTSEADAGLFDTYLNFNLLMNVGLTKIF